MEKKNQIIIRFIFSHTKNTGEMSAKALMEVKQLQKVGLYSKAN